MHVPPFPAGLEFQSGRHKRRPDQSEYPLRNGARPLSIYNILQLYHTVSLFTMFFYCCFLKSAAAIAGFAGHALHYALAGVFMPRIPPWQGEATTIRRETD